MINKIINKINKNNNYNYNYNYNKDSDEINIHKLIIQFQLLILFKQFKHYKVIEVVFQICKQFKSLTIALEGN